MRYFKIALFFFILNVVISIINSIGIVTTVKQPVDGWTDAVSSEALQDQSYSTTSVSASSSSTSFGFGDFIKGFWYFIKAVGYGIFGIPYTFGIFGLEWPYTVFFSLPIYLLYLIGIAQFISNRGMRGMV